MGVIIERLVLVFATATISPAANVALWRVVNQVDATYVSPTQYENYNCKQINAETLRVSTKIEQAMATDSTNQMLNTVVTVFAISQGYGVDGGADNQELTLLRNKLDVLEETSIRKQCNL